MRLLMIEAVFGTAFMLMSAVFWWAVVVPGHLRFRSWVEQRCHVAITTQWRGHWRAEGPGSKLRLFGIESLQFAYFMSAFVVWATGVVLLWLAIALLEKLYQ